MATYDENTRVQVLVKESTEIGEFNDAIYFDKDTYDSMNDADIKNVIDDRVKNWVESVKKASAIDYIPTQEELETQKADLQSQIDAVDVQLSELKSAVSSSKVIA